MNTTTTTTTILSLLLVVILFQAIIITTQQQVHAQQQSDDSVIAKIQKEFSDIEIQRFDICLPIKNHLHDLITDHRLVRDPMTCGQIMGSAKDTCTNSNDTYAYCKDPRYLSWLNNEFRDTKTYGPGTWDFKGIGGINQSPSRL